MKIHSEKLRKANWNLKLSLKDAIINDEIVKLSSSPILRFIDEINGKSVKDVDCQIKEIKSNLKMNAKKDISKETFAEKNELYSHLNDLEFCADYMCLIIDSKKDFYRANKGFILNGLKYRRLVGTTNGVKNETIVYVSEISRQGQKIYKELVKRMDNGRDKTKKLVPAKFEAYKSLACSSSLPLSMPKGVLVVKDCETHFMDKYLQIDDSNSELPSITEQYGEVSLIDSDGYGLVLPSLMKKWCNDVQENYIASGCCIRNAFCKGMVFTFDFIDFAKKVAHNYDVEDVWGNHYDIRDIELVLTESMLKLWDSYDSIEHYLDCCTENGYSFSMTKICPEILDEERTLNYQFIQSYNLSDEDIAELTEPTINEIREVLGLDVNKTILFLKGMGVTEENADCGSNDFVKALMINSEMINDPYVRNRIRSMIKRRTRDAKIGVVNVKGNFQIVCGDPYSLCQSMFNLPVTGLLNAGQVYSQFWSDKNVKEVVGFRAPMTCHPNIRKFEIANTDDMKYWYRYMRTVILFNSWDMAAHAMNGLDKDGDMVFTTNNSVLLRKHIKYPAIQCVQRRAEKKIITEEDLVKADKNGFGDEIGTTTNHITSMYDILAEFDKNSEEYKEIDYRIKCGQHYQQNAIDKVKGIVCKPMPKEWYKRNACKVDGSDDRETVIKKEFNAKIVADKKPYFMNYIYPQQMKQYRTYCEKANRDVIHTFGISYNELLSKESKTSEEIEFLSYYDKLMPVSLGSSTMNRLCWYVESQLNNINLNNSLEPFDFSILKSDLEYSKTHFEKVSKEFEEYTRLLSEFMLRRKQERIDAQEATLYIQNLKQVFKKKCLAICQNDKYELCDIVVDLCYNRNSSKQFAWDISGNEIIFNLLVRSKGLMKYIMADDSGNIEFNGKRFRAGYKRIGGNKNND